MPGARAELLPEAIRELDQAVDWYLERSPGAANAFAAEFERAIKLLVAAPAVWPAYEAGTRRYVLRNFPYSIFYREADFGIEVVAIAHQSRRPFYWRHRRRRS